MESIYLTYVTRYWLPATEYTRSWTGMTSFSRRIQLRRFPTTNNLLGMLQLMSCSRNLHQTRLTDSRGTTSNPVLTYGLMSAFASEPYHQQFNPHTPEPPYWQSAYQNVGYPPVPENRPYGQQPQPPTGWPPQPPQPHPLQQHVTSWQTTAEPYFHNQPPSWQTPPPQHYFHNQSTPSNDYHQSLQQSYRQPPLVTAALPHQNYPQLPPLKTYQPPPSTSPTTYQQPPLTSSATATSLLHQNHQQQPPNAHQPSPSCWNPPSRHCSPTAPLPAATTTPPHADDFRRPSHLHLLSSMEKEWERKLREGAGEDDGDERLCQNMRQINKREENCDEQELIADDNDAIDRLSDRDQVRGDEVLLDVGEILHLADEKKLDSDFQAKDAICSAHIFAAFDRPTAIYSINKKLLYSNVNQKEVSHMCPFNTAAFPILALDYRDHKADSESAITRIQHGRPLVFYNGDDEGGRSFIWCVFDPGGDTSSRFSLSTLFVAYWFPP